MLFILFPLLIKLLNFLHSSTIALFAPSGSVKLDWIAEEVGYDFFLRIIVLIKKTKNINGVINK